MDTNLGSYLYFDRPKRICSATATGLVADFVLRLPIVCAFHYSNSSSILRPRYNATSSNKSLISFSEFTFSLLNEFA